MLAWASTAALAGGVGHPSGEQIEDDLPGALTETDLRCFSSCPTQVCLLTT